MHSLEMIKRMNAAPTSDLENACRLVETAIRQLGGGFLVDVVIADTTVSLRPRCWSIGVEKPSLFEAIKLANQAKRLKLD
jgi:hypothetical protein